ncbi:MAG: PD40 domain-containing protein [Chloroflexia bacterium]|nr:PD40 domain-containing protein [Chloroflexia bacterium]
MAFSLDAAWPLVDSHLYLFDVAAGGIVNLTEDGLNEFPVNDTPRKPVHVDTHPAWSPDGSALVFARSTIPAEEDADSTTTIMRIGRAGGEPSEVLRVRPAKSFLISHPMHWLVDDTLLFALGEHGIWQVGIAGQNPRLVVTGEVEGELPFPWISDVTPDGQLATVVAGRVEGQYVIPDTVDALLEIDSGEVTPITIEGESIHAVSFSPDGATAVIRGSNTETDDPSVLLMDVATGTRATLMPRPLPDNPSANRGFEWNPTGMIHLTWFSTVQWTENDVIFGFTERGAAVLLELERVE